MLDDNYYTQQINGVVASMVDIKREGSDVRFRCCGTWLSIMCAVALTAAMPMPVQAQQVIGALPDAEVIIVGVEPEPTAEHLSAIAGLTPLEQEVARVLDGLCDTTVSSVLSARCGTLRALSDADARRALEQIAPSQLPAQGTSGRIAVAAQVSTISTRLRTLRHSTFGKGVDQFMVSVNETGLTPGGSGGGAGADGALAGRWGLFLTGLLSGGDKDTTERELGFDFDSQGLMTGLDYRFTETMIMGAALGYTVVDADFHDSGGDQQTEALSLSAYGTHYATDTVYVDWIVSYADTDYDVTRNLSTFSTQTQGTTEGSQWALSVNAGAELSRGAMVLSPYGRLEYIDAEIDSYAERGGAGLAIQYEAQRLESLTAALGGRLSRAVSTSWAVLNPSLYVEWIHEFQDDARFINSKFLEDPSVAFSVRTDDPDRDYLKLGLGAAATFARGRSAYISYDTFVDLDHLNYHQLDVGLRVTF